MTWRVSGKQDFNRWVALPESGEEKLAHAEVARNENMTIPIYMLIVFTENINPSLFL